MQIDIVTIFPDYFREAFDYGIVRRARAAGLVEIKAHDLRSWTSDKHKVVDDRPFGGGDGMVLKPEPIFAAVKSLTGASRRGKGFTASSAMLPYLLPSFRDITLFSATWPCVPCRGSLC